MSIFSPVRRYVHGELATLGSEKGINTQSERLRERFRDTPSLKLLAMWAIHEALGLVPALADETLRQMYAARGIDVVGYGASSVAMRVEDQVFRVYHDSFDKSPEEHETMLAELRSRQEKLQKYLPDVVCGQDFTLATNPLPGRQETTIIASHQPYIKDYIPYDPAGDYNDTQRQQLVNMIAAAETMRENEGLLVDIMGQGNVGFSKGNLIIIDTLPIKLASLKPDARHIMLQLYNDALATMRTQTACVDVA